MTTRILIADDDPDAIDLLRNLLEMEKYEVICATDGEEALALAKKEKPDLVMLDVMMPKMAGYEVCEKIRSDRQLSLTPIIILTSLASIKDKITGIKLGADDYISKPYEIHELMARVEGLLSRWKEHHATNPLTSLPGRVRLENELKDRLSQKAEFSFVFFDIKGFRNFNRKYGFDQGDSVIRLISVIIRSAIAEVGNRTDFIGHLGGGLFAVLSDMDRVEVVVARILENFDELIPMQYKSRNPDINQHQLAKSHQPDPEVSLSAGLADITPGQVRHYAEIIDKGKELLKQAKSHSGSTSIRG